jgi:hypothetical protein
MQPRPRSRDRDQAAPEAAGAAPAPAQAPAPQAALLVNGRRFHLVNSALMLLKMVDDYMSLYDIVPQVGGAGPLPSTMAGRTKPRSTSAGARHARRDLCCLTSARLVCEHSTGCECVGRRPRRFRLLSQFGAEIVHRELELLKQFNSQVRQAARPASP